MQTQSLKGTIEQSEVRLRDDHAAARDEVIAAVDDTVQSNQLEHQATREEIAQIKVALQQLSEKMERKNDELRDVLSKFAAATTTKKKQKFQDMTKAITLTLLALETMYCSLKVLSSHSPKLSTLG
jgi:chromosome segregation ATPase